MTAEELRRVMARVRGETAAAPEEIEMASDSLGRAAAFARRSADAAEELARRCAVCAGEAQRIADRADRRHSRAQTELMLLRGDTIPAGTKQRSCGVLGLLRRLCTALESEQSVYGEYSARESGENLPALWSAFEEESGRDARMARKLLERALRQRAGR